MISGTTRHELDAINRVATTLMMFRGNAGRGKARGWRGGWGLVLAPALALVTGEVDLR